MVCKLWMGRIASFLYFLLTFGIAVIYDRKSCLCTRLRLEPEMGLKTSSCRDKNSLELFNLAYFHIFQDFLKNTACHGMLLTGVLNLLSMS